MDRWIGKTEQITAQKVGKSRSLFFDCVSKWKGRRWWMHIAFKPQIEFWALSNTTDIYKHMQISASLLIDLSKSMCTPVCVRTCQCEYGKLSFDLFSVFAISYLNESQHSAWCCSFQVLSNDVCCMHLMVDKHWKLSIPFSFPLD